MSTEIKFWKTLNCEIPLLFFILANGTRNGLLRLTKDSSLSIKKAANFGKRYSQMGALIPGNTYRQRKLPLTKMLPYKVPTHTMERLSRQKIHRLKFLGTFKKENIPLPTTQHRNNKNAHTTVSGEIKSLWAIPANTLFLVSFPRRPWQQQFLKVI